MKKPFWITIIFLMISTMIISIINNIIVYDNHRYTKHLKNSITKHKISKVDLIVKENLPGIRNPRLKNKELISKYLNKSKIKDGECVFFNFWVKRNKNFSVKTVFFPAVWTNANNYIDITSYIKITRDMISVNTTKKK